MSKTNMNDERVISSEWKKTGRLLFELQVQGVTVASISKSDVSSTEWQGRVKTLQCVLRCGDLDSLLTACEACVTTTWLPSVSSWPIRFDRSDVEL